MGSAKGVDRPSVEDSEIGTRFLALLDKADTRTQTLYDRISPMLDVAAGQASDVLTGGSGPYGPAIQAALGSAGQQLSQSTESSKEDWSRMGITGTDYARLAADTDRAGGQQLAGIPSTFTQPLLQQIFAAYTGSQGQAIQSQGQALGSAAGVTETAIKPMAEETISDAFKNYATGTASIVSAARGPSPS